MATRTTNHRVKANVFGMIVVLTFLIFRMGFRSADTSISRLPEFARSLYPAGRTHAGQARGLRSADTVEPSHCGEK
jgi:hypothetical protein